MIELSVWVHSSMCSHRSEIHSCKLGSIHVLSTRLAVEEDLLSLSVRVRLELVALRLLTSMLPLCWSKYLSIEVHLNCGVALKLRKNILHVIHDVR